MATSRLVCPHVLKMRVGGACPSAAPGLPNSRVALLTAAAAAIALLCLGLWVLRAWVRVGAAPEVDVADSFFWAFLEGSNSGPKASSGENERRLDFVRAAVKDLKLRSILQLECGGLHWMRSALQDKSHGIQSFVGVDKCPVVTAANEQTYGGLHGVEFRRGDASALEGLCVDAVVAFDHFEGSLQADPRHVLRSLRRSHAKFLLVESARAGRDGQEVLEDYPRGKNWDVRRLPRDVSVGTQTLWAWLGWLSSFAGPKRDFVVYLLEPETWRPSASEEGLS